MKLPSFLAAFERRPEESGFYRKLSRLAFPIALQNLIGALLNMLDVIMIGNISGNSATEIAAVGLANQLFFVVMLFMFGIVSGAGAFTAQYWGSKNIPALKKVLGIALTGSLIITLLIALPSVIIPKGVMSIYTDKADVLAVSSRYLRIVAPSYLLMGISMSMSAVLRGTGQVRLPLFGSVAGLITNTVLNWVFIFGNLGTVRMGVEGAALATVIARLVELSIIVGGTYLLRMPCAATLKELKYDRVFLSRYAKVAMPILLNEAVWGLGTSMYATVFGRIGKEFVAAANIASIVDKLAWVSIIGVGNASGIMVGHELGADNKELAYIYAKRLIFIIVSCALLMLPVYALGSALVPLLFKVDAATRALSRTYLSITACILPLVAINYISAVGILRSGGDSRFTFWVDSLAVWALNLPATVITGLILHAPPWVVILSSRLDEFLKAPIFLGRIKTKRWLKNIAVHEETI